MSRRQGHARTGGGGRWKGWDRSPKHAPVTVKQGPVREAAPMTDAQAAYLRKLCQQTGEKFNPKWSKRQASKRITQLRGRTDG